MSSTELLPQHTFLARVLPLLNAALDSGGVAWVIGDTDSEDPDERDIIATVSIGAVIVQLGNGTLANTETLRTASKARRMATDTVAVAVHPPEVPGIPREAMPPWEVLWGDPVVPLPSASAVQALTRLAARAGVMAGAAPDGMPPAIAEALSRLKASVEARGGRLDVDVKQASGDSDEGEWRPGNYV